MVAYGQEVLRLLLWAERDASHDMRVCECIQAFARVRIPDFTAKDTEVSKTS
jgi:hypothetical protein